MDEHADVCECAGYAKLLEAVRKDEQRDKTHDYRAKLQWVVDQARHYAEKTGLTACEILDAWEKERDYWYMNYYQESNQPTIKDGAVRIFDTTEELRQSVGNGGFRCPACDGVSKDPYQCDTGMNIKGTTQVCDWKVYGLLGHLGKGIYVFVIDQARGQAIFMPIAWEQLRSEP